MAAALNWLVEMFTANCLTVTLDSCSSRSDKRPEEQRKQNLPRFVMRHDTVRKRWPFRGAALVISLVSPPPKVPRSDNVTRLMEPRRGSVKGPACGI